MSGSPEAGRIRQPSEVQGPAEEGNSRTGVDATPAANPASPMPMSPDRQSIPQRPGTVPTVPEVGICPVKMPIIEGAGTIDQGVEVSQIAIRVTPPTVDQPVKAGQQREAPTEKITPGDPARANIILKVGVTDKPPSVEPKTAVRDMGGGAQAIVIEGASIKENDDGSPVEVFHMNSMRDLQGPRKNRVDVPVRRVVRAGPEAVRYTDIDLHVEIDTRTGDEFFAEATEKWRELKPERAELTGIFIESTGPYVGEVRGELVTKAQGKGWNTQSGVGKYVYDEHGKPNFEPLNPHEKYTKEELQSSMVRTFMVASNRWQNATNARVAGLHPDQLSLVDQKYVRFQEMVTFGHKWYLLSHDNAAGFLDTGNGMALGTIWDLFEVAEEKFEDVHKRPVKKEEADMLYASTLPLTVQLAAGNGELIIPFNKFLRKHGLNSPGISFPFSKEYFTFIQRSEGRPPELAVTQEALNKFERTMESDPQRAGHIEHPSAVTTMCPALAVDDSGNYFPVLEDVDPKTMDVVKATHEWARTVAREYYIPHHFAGA